jgi:hypothetical protein
MDKHLDAESLSDYAEGLAEARARAAAEAHLAGCAQCRRELAAIQAYFRGLADLEPARAPADFLARVRSRLPRPSPWERAWAALLIPFRFIPVPIAVGLIIGVTAITVYMRQGGPENHALMPAPTSSQPAWKDVGPSEGGSEPAAPPAAPSVPSPQSPLRKPVPANRSEFRGKPASTRPKAGLAAKKGADYAPAPEAPAPSTAAQSTPAPSAFQPPASAPPASVGSSDAKASPAKPAPAPSRTPSAGAAHNLKDVEVTGWLDNPSAVYILDNSTPPSDLPLDKAMPVEEENAVPGQAEAAAGHAAIKRKAEDRREEEDRGIRAVPEKKAAPVPTPAPAPASGYALSLRAKADTAAVLAGLRSMGVEAEPEYASSGESRFRLKVPAAMLRELGPYLARHGESRPEGRLPSAPSGSVVSIRLRLLFPAR